MNLLDRLAAAKTAIEEGRFEKAERLLARPLPAAWEPERRRLRGEALRGRGLLGAAVRELQSALKGGPGADPALWCETALAASACLRSLGRAAAAGALLDRVDAAVKRFKLGDYGPELRLERAMLARAEGDWARAVPALQALRNGASGRQRAYLEWALGGAYRFMGDLDAAVRAFEASRKGFLKEKDRLGLGYAECGLAGARRIQGRPMDCILHYSRAARLFEATEDLFGLAYSRCGLANGLRIAGRLGAAERLYAQAEKLYSRLEDPADLAYVEWGQAQLLARTGRQAKAAVLLRRALKRFEAAREHRGAALSLQSLAALEHAAGRSRAGEALFEKAWRTAKKAGLHTHLEVFT